MTPPIITLTTDFGLRDPFVGIMKGVILGICPQARLVDLSHDVAPQDVVEGALVLESATRFFPRETVHLAVIDPGVGSARRALGLRAGGGQYFVGPDNGLFTSALSGSEWAAVALEAPGYRLPVAGQTFHGRDIFAPAAAHLASGVPLERLGSAVTDPRRLRLPDCRMEGEDLVGEVIGSDRFGNLITSVRAEDLAGLEADVAVSVEVGGQGLGRLVTCYEDALEGVPTPIVGSTGRLEVFVRNASARALLGAERGSAVKVRRGSGAA